MKIKISGKSMSPSVLEGSVLTFNLWPRPKSINDVSAGTIVLVKDEEEWIAHRVVILNARKVLKGDGSLSVATNNCAMGSELFCWGELVAIDGRSSWVCKNRYLAWLSSYYRLSAFRASRKLAQFALKASVFLVHCGELLLTRRFRREIFVD